MSAYRVVRNRPPYLALALVALLAGAGIIAAWPGKPEPDIRRLCTAQGGVVVRTLDGPVCLWAGAVIPVRPRP